MHRPRPKCALVDLWVGTANLAGKLDANYYDDTTVARGRILYKHGPGLSKARGLIQCVKTQCMQQLGVRFNATTALQNGAKENDLQHSGFPSGLPR